MASSHPCPNCRRPGLRWVAQYSRWYCDACKQYAPQAAQAATAPVAAAPPAAAPPPGSGLWFQNFYRIRRKVLAFAPQYWIEDQRGGILGYSKAKLFTLKEDIRIYTNEQMQVELFRLQQTQYIDSWATMAVIDSASNQLLGYVRRRWLESSFGADSWEVLDPWNRQVGEIKEDTGSGLLRKYMPGGALIPEAMTMKLGGVPVARIEQQFKIIGDIWELNCLNIYGHVDRRVLLGGLLLMAIIEGRQK